MLKNLSKKVDEINRPTEDYAKKTATNLAKFHISANLDCAELMNRAERREFKRTGCIPLSATRGKAKVVLELVRRSESEI